MLKSYFETQSRRRESLAGWPFVAPWVLGLLFFNLYPFVYSFVLSLSSFQIGYPFA